MTSTNPQTSIIYHNPRCSTSRNALAIMQASGEHPEVIEYLKHPPSQAYLTELLSKMKLSMKGFSPRDLMRSKESIYTELGLDNPYLTDEALIEAMIAHPILINRPIVVTKKGAVLCRPLENIFKILANPVNEFTKENGEVIQNPNL